jgi:hypothetical protein
MKSQKKPRKTHVVASPAQQKEVEAWVNKNYEELSGMSYVSATAYANKALNFYVTYSILRKYMIRHGAAPRQEARAYQWHEEAVKIHRSLGLIATALLEGGFPLSAGIRKHLARIAKRLE